jgi:hypothetical protein
MNKNCLILILPWLALMIVGASEQAHGCIAALRGMKSQYLPTQDGDLCAFADRFNRVEQVLKDLTIDPKRIADIRAPRFIDAKDWLKQVSGQNSNGGYDPRFIYLAENSRPGSVWADWDRAASQVDDLASRLFERSRQGISEPYIFDKNWIRNIDHLSLNESEPRFAGYLRNSVVTGPEINRATAPSLREIENATNLGYPSSLRPGTPIVTWKNTVCLDEISSAGRPSVKESRRFDMEGIPKGGTRFENPKVKGLFHKCGFYEYPSPAEVALQIDLFGRDLTKRMNLLLSANGANSSSADPILIAARAQRWFVSIHPFDAGNGRTSRLIMDFLAQRVGLPAPNLSDMNKDLVTAESDWAAEVGRGMVRVVEILEWCSQNPNAVRCARVP